MLKGEGSRTRGGRSSRAVVIGLIVVSSILLPGAPASADEYHLAAGVTTIQVDGVAGVKLMFPVKASWGVWDVHVEWGTATYFESHLANDTGLRCDGPHCYWGNVIDFRYDWAPLNSCGNEFAPEPRPACFNVIGLQELYILADGSLTLTYRFSELAGVTVLTADRKIDGVLERIPLTCPTGDCGDVSFGGVAHQVREHAYVSIGTYTWVHDWTVVPGVWEGDAGAIWSTVCVYPHRGGVSLSPDPTIHPLGCEDDFGMTFGACVCGGMLHGKVGRAYADGPFYVGVRTEVLEPTDSTDVVAMGVWLNRGMT